jgi:flagellar biosynthesis protein FlhF
MNQKEEGIIRFVAKTAKEAAEIVRNRLGPEGRVVSVEQVAGRGLKRFVSSPQLQIVAKKMPAPIWAKPIAESKTEAEGIRNEALVHSGLEAALPRTETLPSRAEVNCRTLLSRAGFSSNLMARLEGAERWREISELPAREGLSQAIAWLRQYRSKVKLVSEGSRVAFVGCAGAGKTTALCKYLAREVFLHGRSPEVLQLDVNKPHMDTGLSIYCDILGVPCHDDLDQVAGSGTLLIDVPGFSLLAKEEQKRSLAALDAIDADHRVMVMNAAYEASILEKHANVADLLGAAYCVYTHLDELEDVSKMWSCVLNPNRSTLFFSNGQNITGDLVEDSFGYLIERTFPR